MDIMTERELDEWNNVSRVRRAAIAGFLWGVSAGLAIAFAIAIVIVS